VYVVGKREANAVNTALHLRRPLLVTGDPGAGKSTLARAIAHELTLGEVLHWPINSRSMLESALYRYDAVGRLRDTTMAGQRVEAAESDIGRYIRLGPLGTAFAAPAGKPRVLLIDELDKSDIDLPNDLLNVFEEGEFEIPELTRLAQTTEAGRTVEVGLTGAAGPAGRTSVTDGIVRCTDFPVVVITSNGEREFPPAFLRRCVRLRLTPPGVEVLDRIIEKHLSGLPDHSTPAEGEPESLAEEFVHRQRRGQLATDQLLNAAYLRVAGVPLDKDRLTAVLQYLAGS
jgi:MoxR-like ATPase